MYTHNYIYTQIEIYLLSHVLYCQYCCVVYIICLYNSPLLKIHVDYAGRGWKSELRMGDLFGHRMWWHFVTNYIAI